jgi:CheY-like chemotaxis protein
MPNRPGSNSPLSALNDQHQGPAAAPADEGSELPAPQSTPAPAWGPRVLVVDDDEVSRRAAVGLLQTLGLTVDIAADGREALDMSSRWAYTAIFLDCGMPDMDGYTVARQIRRREGTNLHTPVIAVTSHPRSVSLASGMDHHLSKPLRIDVLAPDCTRLGLLARNGAAPHDPPPQLAGDTPLLDPSMFEELAREYRLSPEEPAAMFIEAATSRLPELWRAANAVDGATLRRLAIDLKARAALVGARRVADLCGHLSEVAGRRADGIAQDIAAALRQALQDTRDALMAYIEGAPPTTPSVAPAAGRGDAAAIRGRNDSDPRARVRVVLAEDDALARVAIGAMLDSADWLELVGDASGVEDIVELTAAQRPDVVVLDWLMPGGGGAQAARRILDQCPHTLIVGLTSSDSPEALSEMTSAGAACLVAKGGSADQLTQTIGRALKAAGAGRAAEGHSGSAPAGLGAASRPGTTGASPGPLDQAAVQRLRSEFGATGVLAELVDLFGSQTPERLTYMRNAIDGDNPAALRDHAHQLKGGCLTLAATDMAELCDELETTAGDGSLTGACARVDEIEAAFKQAQVALLRELA